uniref:pyrroline-5-carboxylate reductase n=1 Tax=Equus caballus TaxID=9796 RepID=A0A9L0TLW4_HORSE
MAAAAGPSPGRVGFVGAGRMAEAIAQGLIRAGKVEAQHVLASAPTDRNLCHFRVCTFSEALAEGAIKMGMPSGLAHRIAAQTLLGTAKMLLQKGQHPAQLRTDVCTPGGTTIYGLHALEQGGLRAATMSAVEAATCRARELSRK